jgi:hypothetical protein
MNATAAVNARQITRERLESNDIGKSVDHCNSIHAVVAMCLCQCLTNDHISSSANALSPLSESIPTLARVAKIIIPLPLFARVKRKGEEMEIKRTVRVKNPKKRSYFTKMYLHYSLYLLLLQLSYLERDHPDLAQTYTDVSNGIECSNTHNVTWRGLQTEHCLGGIPVGVESIEGLKWIFGSGRELKKRLRLIRDESKRIAGLYTTSYNNVQLKFRLNSRIIL